MLKVNQVSKSYGLETVLSAATFGLGQGERVGLVGPNGCGKSTLLRIAAGLEPPDTGSVQRTPASLRVGYLPQGLVFDPSDRLCDYLERAGGDPVDLSGELERLAGELARAPGQPDLEAAYDDVLARLSAGAQDPARVAESLSALGLDQVPLDTPIAQLSGGQKTRLALLGILLGDPQLLLLDEPTNPLDIDMLLWLERWNADYRGAVLIVSHDRAFLDRTVTAILELDPASRALRAYAGNYTDYVDQKMAEADRERLAYSDQQIEINRLRDAARHMRGLARVHRGGKADSGDKFAKGFFANRGAATVGRAKNLERRLEHILTEERLEKPRASWQMKLDFGAAPPSGQDVVILAAYQKLKREPFCTSFSLAVMLYSKPSPICPMANAPGWRWPGWWCRAATCSCSTNRLTTWTFRPARGSSRRCAVSRAAFWQSSTTGTLWPASPLKSGRSMPAGSRLSSPDHLTIWAIAGRDGAAYTAQHSAGSSRRSRRLNE